MTIAEEKSAETAPSTTVAPGLRLPLAVSSLALFLGVSVEILFHGHPPGISLPIWVVLCILVLLISCRLEGIRPSAWGLLLPIPILFLAVMCALRREPFTGFVNLVLMLSLMALWVRSFRSRSPFEYGWLDFGLALAWAPLMSWIFPWGVLAQARKRFRSTPSAPGRFGAVLRGVLLALPVILVLAALLHSADLVFAASVDRALSWLNLQVLAEWVNRFIVILVSGLFLLGAIAAALKAAPDWKPFGRDKPIFRPFVGFTETTVVVAAVDLLFAFFVGIQFRYLFGGEANINAAGFTYAEYARRGFGELVAVAVLSMGLILLLANWTKIEGSRQRWTFAALCGTMVALMGAILASALVRLLLYENAYGFTRLRTYTHVAIVWMGVLFAAFLALLLAGQLRRLPLAAVAGALGFAITLNALNVDAFVVRQNGARLDQSGEIDLEYLLWLSEDADPALVRLAADVPAQVQQELLPQLACRSTLLEKEQQGLSWPSYHFSRAASRRALATLAVLQDYEVIRDSGGVWYVTVEGEDLPCEYQPWSAILE